jgi:hypothetical protein
MSGICSACRAGFLTRFKPERDAMNSAFRTLPLSSSNPIFNPFTLIAWKHSSRSATVYSPPWREQSSSESEESEVTESTSLLPARGVIALTSPTKFVSLPVSWLTILSLYVICDLSNAASKLFCSLHDCSLLIFFSVSLNIYTILSFFISIFSAN